MRKLILIAAFALASCGGNEQTDTNSVAEETEATDIGPVNDITAIDAATGEAANMAADVDYSFNEGEFNEADGNSATNTAGNSSR